jgi:hypothetical protein
MPIRAKHGIFGLLQGAHFIGKNVHIAAQPYQLGVCGRCQIGLRLRAAKGAIHRVKSERYVGSFDRR